jgi:hypothetical protein
MTKIYKLKFKCCGSELTLGMEREIGNHGDYCLACNTENPKTEIISDNDYY